MAAILAERVVHAVMFGFRGFTGFRAQGVRGGQGFRVSGGWVLFRIQGLGYRDSFKPRF